QPQPSTAQPTNEETILNVVSSSHQKIQTPRQALNKVTELPQTSEPIPNVANEAIYEEWDDIVERAATTTASLDAKQASGNINRTQSTAMPNVPLYQGISAGGSLRCQGAMGVPLLRIGLRGEDLMMWFRLLLHSSGISTASRLFSTAEESISTAGASMPVSTA
nr:hypothetical protein [Tanacetum cinerariifolium]